MIVKVCTQACALLHARITSDILFWTLPAVWSE